ncbi:MAG: 1-acyl-sn-glycerol-3-phosphate acyltransferase [Bacilli bacterium]|nr:1-acyl-sn-glycerol-3-phosphate acyltransferase [Bacilli bacterium]
MKNVKSGKIAAFRFRMGSFVARIVFGRIARKQFGIKLRKNIEMPKGPKIVMCNHVTTYGPYMVALSLKGVYHMMAAKDFVPFKYRRLLNYWFSPIWKDKSLHDSGLVMDCLRLLRKGESILFFPEGNRTFSTHLCYISPATAKLVAKSKATVVYVNVKGGLTVDPRFSLDIRKGKFEISVRKVRTPEEIASMSLEELRNDIIENLTVDDVPSPWPSISERRAEKLERVLYRCPCCGKISTIRSEGNLVKCDACGLEVTYGAHLLFENPNKEGFRHKELYTWYAEQEEYVRGYEAKPGELIYSDPHVSLHRIALEHRDEPVVEDAELKMTDETISFGDFSIPLDEIIEMAVTGKQAFLFYHNKETYRASSSTIGFNALKYLQMHYHLRNKKTGASDDFLGI